MFLFKCVGFYLGEPKNAPVSEKQTNEKKKPKHVSAHISRFLIGVHREVAKGNNKSCDSENLEVNESLAHILFFLNSLEIFPGRAI